jgi:hypothetical protein
MNKIDIALIINGFAAGWLLARGGFTWDCYVAFIAIGATTIYLIRKKDK